MTTRRSGKWDPVMGGDVKLSDCGPIASSPLSYSPPFMAPFQRKLNTEDERRLVAWFESFFPGEPIELVEWVGTDLRQPLHAIVVRFLNNDRPSIVLKHKVDEIERHHVAQALRVRS